MIRALNSPDNAFSCKAAHVARAIKERREVIRMLLVTAIVFYGCVFIVCTTSFRHAVLSSLIRMFSYKGAFVHFWMLSGFRNMGRPLLLSGHNVENACLNEIILIVSECVHKKAILFVIMLSHNSRLV